MSGSSTLFFADLSGSLSNPDPVPQPSGHALVKLDRLSEDRSVGTLSLERADDAQSLPGFIVLLAGAAVSASELPHSNIEATCRAAPSMQAKIRIRAA